MRWAEWKQSWMKKWWKHVWSRSLEAECVGICDVVACCVSICTFVLVEMVETRLEPLVGSWMCLQPFVWKQSWNVTVRTVCFKTVVKRTV
jgi:hypothetical protein